ncbi:MAG: (5-formylfuran-3-yl)methyl phosphate synthase [Solirubrobacteraceae bacterium]
MRLLVSVVDAREARTALAGGADIVDVKNPSEGSLGAPVPRTIADVRAAVPAAIPVSVALGDMPSLPGTAALAALGAATSGATYVKVGLWGTSTEDAAIALLRATREALTSASAVSVIAAGYADAERLPGRPLAPHRLPHVARAAGVAGCLLDTGIKDGRGLFHWLSPPTVLALVDEAHDAGLEVAVAGGLSDRDLPTVLGTGADIAGVRSAACRDGVRTAPLDRERIRRLRSTCLV